MVRIWIGCPSSSGARRSCTVPFERSRTACSASFGPIAVAASRPVAPSGSSSSVESGRTTFMDETKDTQHPREDDQAATSGERHDSSGANPTGTAPREDDRNEEVADSPVPDPTQTNGDAEGDPGAD